MAKFGLTTKRTKVTKNSRKDCLSFVLFVVETIPAVFCCGRSLGVFPL